MLNRIDFVNLTEIISKLVTGLSAFKNYQIDKSSEQSIVAPTILKQFDFVFTSVRNDRWLLFRIEDYFKNQRIIIWINTLKSPRPVNIDVETYFVEKLGKRNSTQNFSLNVKGSEIEKALDAFLTFFLENSDNLLVEILEGKKWIDMDFDWQGYK